MKTVVKKGALKPAAPARQELTTPGSGGRRAFVARLTLDSVQFHVALAFDRALDVHVEGYPLPDVLAVLEVEPGKRYPVAALPADIEFTDLPSA